MVLALLFELPLQAPYAGIRGAGQSLLHNDHNHRVAASDIDFKFSPDCNSGALYCYLLSVLR
jgi:hypothetical protein